MGGFYHSAMHAQESTKIVEAENVYGQEYNSKDIGRALSRGKI